MIYAKTTVNGIPQETPLSELPLFCKCPECGTEVKTDVYDMLEATKVFEDFDPDAFDVYCDGCNEALDIAKESIRIMNSALDRMPLDKLQEIHSIMLPFWHKDDEQV